MTNVIPTTDLRLASAWLFRCPKRLHVWIRTDREWERLWGWGHTHRCVFCNKGRGSSY